MTPEEALRLAKEEELHLPAGTQGNAFQYVYPSSVRPGRPYEARPVCPNCGGGLSHVTRG